MLVFAIITICISRNLCAIQEPLQVEKNRGSGAVLLDENFGIVRAGSVVQREIALTETPADFKIDTITSTCGCAVATHDGDSKVVLVKWTIPNETGAISKQIKIAGKSNQEVTTISLELKADARKLLAFEHTKALWSIDVNSQSPDSKLLKVCNDFEDLKLQSPKAFVEVDSVNVNDGKLNKLEVPVSILSKEEIAATGSFCIYSLELSADLMRKIPSQMRSIDVVFEAIDGTGKTHQVHCDVTVRRGSKLVARIVSQNSPSEVVVDLFVRLSPDQWNWSELSVHGGQKDNELEIHVQKKSDYYGRITIKNVAFGRPHSITLSIIGEKFVGSTTLELR